MRSLILLLALATAASAASFSARFEEIKKAATPAELYTFLYALPKGGDIHNHSGSERPEWIYAILTDPARNGGDTFYTRARIPAAPDAIAPAKLYHNLRQSGYDHLAPNVRAEYVRLDALTPAERTAWCDSLRLDKAGEGREEFFAVLWPRRGQIGSSLPVITECLVENIKAFGAEHLSYLETQFDVDRVTDNAGNLIPLEDAVAYVKKRLAQPDVVASGVTVRFQDAVLRFLPGTEAEIARASTPSSTPIATSGSASTSWESRRTATGIRLASWRLSAGFASATRRSRSPSTPARWTATTRTSATRSSSVPPASATG